MRCREVRRREQKRRAFQATHRRSVGELLDCKLRQPRWRSFFFFCKIFLMLAFDGVLHPRADTPHTSGNPCVVRRVSFSRSYFIFPIHLETRSRAPHPCCHKAQCAATKHH